MNWKSRGSSSPSQLPHLIVVYPRPKQFDDLVYDVWSCYLRGRRPSGIQSKHQDLLCIDVKPQNLISKSKTSKPVSLRECGTEKIGRIRYLIQC
mmetsp:Transcript_51385/g.148331  ORF Transcript_51385/g.148331 Transcript_51385/m.148331 type:complete len:94 (-) Transcript_51385:1218-1499(-)